MSRFSISISIFQAKPILRGDTISTGGDQSSSNNSVLMVFFPRIFHKTKTFALQNNFLTFPELHERFSVHFEQAAQLYDMVTSAREKVFVTVMSKPTDAGGFSCSRH